MQQVHNNGMSTTTTDFLIYGHMVCSVVDVKIKRHRHAIKNGLTILNKTRMGKNAMMPIR